MSDRWDVDADGYFAVMPYWVGDADISDRAFRLYYLLRQKADNASHKVFGGRKRFAELLKCSPASFDRAAKELEDLGALVVHRDYDAGTKRWKPNGYTMRASRPYPTCGIDPPIPQVGYPPSPTSETPSLTGDDASYRDPSLLDPEPPAATPSAPAEAQLDLVIEEHDTKARSEKRALDAATNRVIAEVQRQRPKLTTPRVALWSILRPFLAKGRSEDELIRAAVDARAMTRESIEFQFNPPTSGSKPNRDDTARAFLARNTTRYAGMTKENPNGSR